MAKRFVIRHPSKRNRSRPSALPQRFVLFGTSRAVTLVRAEVEVRLMNADGTAGAVVGTSIRPAHIRNQRCFVLCQVAGVNQDSRYIIKVTAVDSDGNEHVDRVRAVRFRGVAARPDGEVVPAFVAPSIIYPPEDDPYYITGGEQTYFVTEGETDSDIYRPTIEVNNTPVEEADEFDSFPIPGGKYWYGVFLDMSSQEDAILKIVNQSDDKPLRVVID